jgi:starvation-inducible DNA-binding protein
MFKTKNDLTEDVCVMLIELLNARLADAIDLQTQTKQAHWSIKGPTFIALHELFDKINEDVEDYVNAIAERAVQLGGMAEGTVRLAAFGKSARKAINDANNLGDLDTADLFTEISRGIDKWLWFGEAHLQAER